MNGYFRAIQSNDLQSVKYWLTQIEKMTLSMVSHYDQEKEKVQSITKSVHDLCKFSHTTQSAFLSQQISDWFLETSQEQQRLQQII